MANYARSSLSPVLFPPQSNGIELLVVLVHFHSQLIHIACFYCPPSKLQDLSPLINTLSPLGPAFASKLLLVGDVNVNISASPSPPLMSHINTVTSLLSLQQVVHSPTHFTPSGSSSTIDLIFVAPSFKSVVSILPPVGTSDHCAISLLLSLPPISVFTQRHPFPIKEYGSTNGRTLIKSMTISLPLTCHVFFQLILTMLSLFYELFFDVVHQLTPSKLVSCSPLPPWLPRLLLRKIQNRRRLFA